MPDKKRGALPPLPELPRRNLTPPARKAISGTFTLESDTPTKNVTATEYRALVSVFEVLSPDRRNDLTEIGHLIRRLTIDQRKRLLDLALELNGLG